MDKERARPQERCWAVATLALCAAALLWTGWHLRWSTQALRAELTIPVAAARHGEAMPSRWNGLLGTGASPVAVNKAEEQALCRLPGIGPVTARDLIAQRETWGPFFFPEDLLNVKGITQKKLEKLAPEITLER
ncbi:MAG: helix-hairpin-helix domain-containing protein [Candidatus Limiplasma sp.]|nr:helix-hairpin-helix domain-containing protein [Candidatus Limiplasma sp.]